MDFFVVPTVNFSILYVFFVIQHGKREIIHFNVTEHPTAQWVKQQLRDVFEFDSILPEYLIFDRDSIFSLSVKQFIKDIGIKPKITSYRSPWQNAIAERWVLSVRSEVLNHVVIFNNGHLRRIVREYIAYYNYDRCHLSLNRDAPKDRQGQNRPSAPSKVISFTRLNGLQHLYKWKESA